MNFLNEEELNKISVMYEGDLIRDASSKIRGFLFQDYITINCLLQEGVEYVCSEYLEDVDVFFTDGTFEFIQVKYYPRTAPNKDEISTDLYYQFLRLNILQSKLSAIPRLYIHREQTVNKPTTAEMVNYVKKYTKLPKLPDAMVDLSESNISDWLRQNIYSTNNKQEQKKRLFSKLASMESIKEFVDRYDIVHQKEISVFKTELMEALETAYPNSLEKVGVDAEKWPSILLGLAISYIQKRYLKDSPNFEELRVGKKEFDDYMHISTLDSDLSGRWISSYLVEIICERYGDIISKNNLSDLQIRMLNEIYQNTIRWINELCKDWSGQYRLLNTISLKKKYVLYTYETKLSLSERINCFKESRRDFYVFLSYMWKIMLNICQEKVKDEIMISENIDLFRPWKYMESKVTDYVCFNFPDDKYVNHSIILPRAGHEPNSVLLDIICRLKKMPYKPKRWFFENSDLKKRVFPYEYNIVDLGESSSYNIVDFDKDFFCVECMHCIKIDAGKWPEMEICSNCIFSENCIEKEPQNYVFTR